jgi:cytidine deaminase
MDTELVNAARQVRGNAYAPYSGYHVGAALRAADGRIFTGCNVENTSYGLTICAERAAVCGAVAAGARAGFTAVAVATGTGGTPCGACLQVLAEFAPAAPKTITVYLADEGAGTVRETTLAALLPDAFRLRDDAPLPGQRRAV